MTNDDILQLAKEVEDMVNRLAHISSQLDYKVNCIPASKELSILEESITKLGDHREAKGELK